MGCRDNELQGNGGLTALPGRLPFHRGSGYWGVQAGIRACADYVCHLGNLQLVAKHKVEGPSAYFSFLGIELNSREFQMGFQIS